MNSAVTEQDAIKNYQEAYAAFFGLTPPPVRKLESGALDVRFEACSKRYRLTELMCVTAMMLKMVDN